MSGGHWDYQGFKLKDILEQIGNDPQVKERFPKLAGILPKLGDILYEMEHDLDWDLSHDQYIENDKAFESKIIASLRDATGDHEVRILEKKLEDAEWILKNIHESVDHLSCAHGFQACAICEVKSALAQKR